ncbi:MAG: hypothetical protein A2836_02260 [Candidatus Taylorbacteria bacterium RIFCSPHIGHO2_01_FULL_45_63]|uniref:Uncharacterized protein n=1 Tax=Candidatus Taylorbacteria bacterium RIFCSPHIGHO2_02_FULL_45_35 TaxID=1802311 RepID=A0A1G2MNT4_9BACT|nr:MAG: hypothetical protein A2836_02260 [Candidatus Taylorbacteria bacterium RIFCSPHIGHO2_01_FULL_45_63]OHA25404.1 MAG: hypothetical protein A3D56_01300 [Candidatus Taylorbacteria bacterium RIFCSPHIGHO2_02_FULL_45_35]OHA33589.1 MAG: hypothetical protein A3A22_03155 [Candidatus Taylorbacteria bacterium RIFCSPLOWO2_01_FULL_45_34b]
MPNPSEKVHGADNQQEDLETIKSKMLEHIGVLENYLLLLKDEVSIGKSDKHMDRHQMKEVDQKLLQFKSDLDSTMEQILNESKRERSSSETKR